MAESFDIVSQVDMQEVRNAVLQTAREVSTRYDLKRAAAEAHLEDEEIRLEAADNFSVAQALDVLKTRLVRRGVDLKSARYGDVQPASRGRARQRITFQQGIPKETAKRLIAEVKKLKLKVQVSIQGESLRVSGKKRDDLQQVIAHLRDLDLDLPLTFKNYRSS
jgi:uncharacterized protein YajQ (UPF0234 family)